MKGPALALALSAACLVGCTASAPAPEPAAERLPGPARRPSSPEAARPTDDASFLEPEPVPFVGGRPSWRQEPWWTLRVWGALPRVVYEVGPLYGITPAGRPFDRPWLNPRPPEEWLALRCRRCSHDANPDGRAGAHGGILSFSEDDDVLDDARRARVAADVEQAAGGLHPEGQLRVDEDGWVWLTHTPEAHLRVMAWLRPRACKHGPHDDGR
ncbi:MAG: hypothetical protein M9894_30095 [Planctomycetes bacterium]|nr:hypothetical protein [Planctomycetota bacterium]